VDWDGQRRVIYHYHWVFDFPYNAGCMRGQPIVPWNGAPNQTSAQTSAAKTMLSEPHIHPHQPINTTAAMVSSSPATKPQQAAALFSPGHTEGCDCAPPSSGRLPHAHPAPLPATADANEAQVREIAGTLLRNAYHAFEHEAEGDVKNTLAHYVRGDVLADLYLKIHKGLTMQAHGDTAATARSVKLIASDNLRRSKDMAFTERLTWTVEGAVEHSGHRHTQVNQFTADFTIQPVDGAWKIVAMRMAEDQPH
jgi:hypothetical protein